MDIFLLASFIDSVALAVLGKSVFRSPVNCLCEFPDGSKHLESKPPCVEIHV